MNDHLIRRSLLKAGALAGMASLGGCCWLKSRDPSMYCPSGSVVSAPDGRLTIDSHAHMFNGSDLPVEPFFRLVLAREAGLPGAVARVLGELLQAVAIGVAPGAKREIAMLDELMPEIASCGGRSIPVIDEKIRALANEAHRQGVLQLKQALASASGARIRTLAVQRAVVVEPALTMAMRAAFAIGAEIDRLDPAEDYEAYRRRRRDGGPGAESLDKARRSARGMIAFVLQNFQYRYVTIHDYLLLYNQPGKRVVDMVMPMMVDYDWWLAEGRPTASGLEDQVSVMEKLAIATGGRVHGFVPFDPLREVMHGLDRSVPSSFELVKRALDRGCIGVKLYPPMGFAPLGNAAIHQANPRFWHRDWLPDAVKVADLGQRLDEALDQLYRYCAHKDNDVPIMAHTGLSNGPSEEFEALAGAGHWKTVLQAHRRLRINFGHFGDTAPLEHGDNGDGLAYAFTELMQADGPGKNAYADSGYFIETMQDSKRMRKLLQRLYSRTEGKGSAALENRFLYGTDWEMTITHGPVDSYLTAFEALFDDLAREAPLAAGRADTLARKFFGTNAVDYAGLRAPDRTRKRLQDFYERNRVPAPDWMRKVDALAALAPPGGTRAKAAG